MLRPLPTLSVDEDGDEDASSKFSPALLSTSRTGMVSGRTPRHATPPYSSLAFQLVSGVKRFREKCHQRRPARVHRSLSYSRRMLEEKREKTRAEDIQVARSIPACLRL